MGKLPASPRGEPERFEEAIIFLAKLFENYQYAIRGTASLVLQKIDMNVDDIDILTDKNTALLANELLKDYLLEKAEYKESSQFKSYFGKFKINDILVEVMGEWQIKDSRGKWSEVYNASEKEKKQISLGGQKVWVTSMETELSIFAKMGRWNAYNKIKKQRTSSSLPLFS